MTSIQATPVAPGVSVGRPRLFGAKRVAVVTADAPPQESEIQATTVVEPIVLKESPREIFEKYMKSHLSDLLIAGCEDDSQRELLQSTIKTFITQCADDLNVMLFQHANQSPTTGRKTCAGTRADGHSCTSPFVVKGSDYCSHHDPRKATSPKTPTKASSPKEEKMDCQGHTKKNEPCKALKTFCKKHIAENGQTVWLCARHITQMETIANV